MHCFRCQAENADGSHFCGHCGASFGAPPAGDEPALHVTDPTRPIPAGGVAANPTDPRPIGLTLRSAPRLGAEVIRVEPQSAAFRAGLQAGDVITVVGDLERPTAAAASRALAAGGVDRPVVIGITRAGRHHVLALDRKW